MATARDDFVEFFNNTKKGIYICPVCAHHEFAIDVDKGTEPPELSYMQAGTHIFHGISCLTCGHTTLFHSNQFDTWRRRKYGGGTV